MTFSEIFDRVLTYWPETISISDGKPIPLSTGGSGWSFPTLNRALDEVERRIDHRKDTWGSLMAWTMFQVFHTEAKNLRQNCVEVLMPQKIDQTIVEQRYFENLHSEGWEEELAKYRRT